MDLEIEISFAKHASVWLLCYLFGYFQFSLAWLILPVVLHLIRKHNDKRLLLRRRFVKNLIDDNEEEVISHALPELPSWVMFPNVEKAQWLNKIIKQLWPVVRNYFRDIAKDLLQAKLNKKIKKYGLSGLTVEKLVIGTTPFQIGGITVFESGSDNEITMDIDILYAGDCDITIKYSKVTGGLKDFQMYGKLRVVLKPLIDQLPLIGGAQIFFLNPPEVGFNLDGLAGVLELPVFNEMLKKAILDTICSTIVLPNKFPIKFSKLVSNYKIQFPEPKGVLRVHIVQARNLLKRDINISGEQSSDPYAVVTIGDQEFKTSVAPQTDNPKWDFWCEFVIEEIDGVFLYLELFDKDNLKSDEWLGKTKIPLSSLIEESTVDKWCQLERIKQGEIHIRTTWLNFSKNYEDLKLTLTEIQRLQVSTLSSALLIVFINCAEDLPPTKKPDACVQITVGKQEKTTKAYKKSGNPLWEEGFCFLINNPEDESVVLKVANEKDDQITGELIYNISALFGENDLTIEKQTFKLAQCKTEGKINISLALKILINESPENWIPNDYSTTEPNSLEIISHQDPEGIKNTSEHSKLSEASPTSSVIQIDKNDNVRSDITSTAKIKLTLRYSVQRQRLVVVVHHIEDMRFDESKGIYVKLYLLPERHKDTKRKTQIVKTGKNLVFDETFEFVISQDELAEKHLEVSVCEERVIKNEDIEKVVIDLDKLSLVLPHTRLFTLYKKSHES